jgi:hypothetical protein
MRAAQSGGHLDSILGQPSRRNRQQQGSRLRGGERRQLTSMRPGLSSTPAGAGAPVRISYTTIIFYYECRLLSALDLT